MVTSYSSKHRRTEYGTVAPASGAVPTVASAAALPYGGPIFFVSGSVAITSITGAPVGVPFTLIFLAACTLTNNAAIKLAGSVNFVGTAEDTITLVNDGTVIRELARAVI